MNGEPPETWPGAWHQLISELRGSRGRFALIAGSTSRAGDDLVDQLQRDLDVAIVQLSARLADRPQPPTPAEVESACGDATVIADLELLMWPDMHISALHLLSVLARRRPTIGVWPGAVHGARAVYSAPGRPDYQDAALRDVIVLRPRRVTFPDEVPFTIERVTP